MTISIINGPNINLIGSREPEIYGKQNINDFIAKLVEQNPDISITHYQSNSEGGIIDQIQNARTNADAIIINPAGYTHTSIAIADAIAAVDLPTVEVHISNIFQREEFRQKSYTAKYCKAVIMGMGLHGYQSAIDFIKAKYFKK